LEREALAGLTTQPEEELDESAVGGSPATARQVGFTEQPSGRQAVTNRVLIFQEIIRGLVALVLLGLVAWIVAYAAFQSGGKNWNNTKDWLQIVLPTMAAFLGSALGFYFSGFVSITPRR
jgi:sterol desaturase/sphingolipid hydroxylase (fatty acid hydroxylase superfamily)